MNLALESGYFNTIGHGAAAIVLYAIVGLVLMIIGFYAIDLTTPGKLRDLVRSSKPNAVIVSASGMVSMALIVVLAIYSSSGKLAEGLLAAFIFGLIGIAAQVVSVRLVELVTGIEIGDVLASDVYVPDVWVVAAAHVSLGLIVAVAIL
ncbi:DUF350 domain-containing protein [Skermania sp. ID1734]|uniref:DUF350 domain-containing protein n=1 Tax=Skermania sp. ID1734 TaxID=2597516 RepID=UPI00117D25FA|nr:DUF350 domain-containing protein [Skermania sp. ID1734]TSE01266.1 DUF350 domain-containing protein [Skermania sp. ID1734]